MDLALRRGNPESAGTRRGNAATCFRCNLRDYDVTISLPPLCVLGELHCYELLMRESEHYVFRPMVLMQKSGGFIGYS